MKKIIFLSLLLILPLMAGCLDIEERVVIMPDGSSALKFKMRMAIPVEAKKKNPAGEIQEQLSTVGSGVDGVRMVDFGIEDKYGQLIFSMNLQADSFSALRKAYATFPRSTKKKRKKSGNDIIDQIFSKKGFYSIKKKRDKLVIERTIGLKKKRKKSKDEDLDMLVSMMGAISMHFDLEVPSRVLSSNAEEVDGNTLHWIIPLQYLENNRVTLRAEIEATPELIKSIH